jgi:YidC/Oxa1 family membrane protein insertase
MSKYARIIFFALAFLLVWSFLTPKKDIQSTDDVVLEAKSEITIGKALTINVRNNTSADLPLPSFCPKNPLKVERYLNGEWSLIEAEAKTCKPETIIIASKKLRQINYAPWNQQLFKELGKYRITLEQTVDGKTKTYSKEIDVTPPGIFTTMFREAFYKPIFNTLIFLISFQPGHSLGWAIILLTLIVKLILLVPNQKALKAQKQMQKVQPQLDALKKKYKDNPSKLAEETMLIWKKYKVNPMSSCLPMLLQFPVLIALFYVVKDGLGYINPELLYGSLKGFDASSINTIFLGIIDLTKVNLIVLPVAIGLLQFFQMKMTLGKSMGTASDNSPMPMMNKTMIYVMPLMIAFFTASLPAAVGFYWGTSTLFGIAQQFVVNRSKD